MKVRATITQTLDIELPDDTDFMSYRRRVLGDLSIRYDQEEAHCSGTPEEILLTTMESVLGGESTVVVSQIDVIEVVIE